MKRIFLCRGRAIEMSSERAFIVGLRPLYRLSRDFYQSKETGLSD